LTAEASHELTGTNERTLKAINIGFVPSIFKGTIHEIIKPLWKSNCVLRIQQNPLPQLMEPFEEGKLDLIVATTHPGKLEKDWVVKRLGVRQLIIIGSPKYKSLRSNFPKSVESIPLITATETNPSRYAIDSFFERHKVQPNVIAEIDDPDLLSLALEDGYGIGVMSHNAAAELIHERRLIEIGEIYDVDSQLWAITHESSNPLVQSAISKFKTAINRISK
jgi:LysR family transcriptional activator of nhaA